MHQIPVIETSFMQYSGLSVKQKGGDFIVCGGGKGENATGKGEDRSFIFIH